MEDIYETEVWQNLNKNVVFKDKFDETMKKCLFYANKQDINMTVINNKLVVSYKSRLMNREMNCQYVTNTKYEFFMDNDSNLIINKLSGSLRSNYGYDFENHNGGVLDTNYSCFVYDIDGVELSYQGYSDSYDVNKIQFSLYKDGFLSFVETVYNPNLPSVVNTTGLFFHPNAFGDSGRFVSQIRSKDNLGIVINSSCEFNSDGEMFNPKEEYYFNTFLSKQAVINPKAISFTRDYPFATVDENNIMHFNNIYTNSGLTPKNYQEVASERFLKELIEEKTDYEKIIPKDILEKYDLMIKKMEMSNSLRRTR